LLTSPADTRRTGPLEPHEKQAIAGFAVAAGIQAIAGVHRAGFGGVLYVRPLLAACGIVIVGALWLLRVRKLPGHALAVPVGLVIATAGLYAGYTAMSAPFGGFLSRFSVPLLLVFVGALLLFAEQDWQFQRWIFALAAILFVVAQTILTLEARAGGQAIPTASSAAGGGSGIMSELQMVEVGQSFVSAINAHDSAAIAALTTPDHRFIDSQGNAVAAVPGDRIEVTRWMSDGNTIVAIGTAAGTPAAWRAVIRDGRVAEWQVYGGGKR
jgi:hypothetical protein